MSNSCTLAACYFGNYHPGDARSTRLKGALDRGYLEAIARVNGG